MNYENMRSLDPTLLARLQSIYSLTLDEFQNTINGMGLAKDFGLMNMDEFLKNIWTAEDNRALASSSFSASDGLQQQGSLTLPWTISQKIVDEVWRDFGGQHEFEQQSSLGEMTLEEFLVRAGVVINQPPVLSAPEQQPSLGEMTMAEFLVQAGVVREDVINQPPVLPAPVPIFVNTITTPVPNNNNGMFYNDLPLPLSSSSCEPRISLTFGQPGPSNEYAIPNSTMTRAYTTDELVSPKRMKGGGLVGFGMGYPEMSDGLMPGMVGIWGGEEISAGTLASPANQIASDRLAMRNGVLSSLLPTTLLNGAQSGRKNGADDKAVERRQKRLMQSRVSAARSRAKKRP